MHPLIVHATVVFVPLAVLGALVVVLSPAARQRYVTLVLALGTAAVVFLTGDLGARAVWG